jgi:hypothetical protein
MKAEEVIEKCKADPNYELTIQQLKDMGREEFAKFIYLCFDLPHFRKNVVDWYMKLYEPYFNPNTPPTPKPLP